MAYADASKLLSSPQLERQARKERLCLKAAFRSITRFEAGESIVSRDHRVVQAIVMLGKVEGKEISVVYPSSVSKSWPQFWRFIESVNKR
jgi:5-enolpyruvylshikimate-3-phosphate synthase